MGWRCMIVIRHCSIDWCLWFDVLILDPSSKLSNTRLTGSWTFYFGWEWSLTFHFCDTNVLDWEWTLGRYSDRILFAIRGIWVLFMGLAITPQGNDRMTLNIVRFFWVRVNTSIRDFGIHMVIVLDRISIMNGCLVWVVIRLVWAVIVWYIE